MNSYRIPRRRIPVAASAAAAAVLALGLGLTACSAAAPATDKTTAPPALTAAQKAACDGALAWSTLIPSIFGEGPQGPSREALKTVVATVTPMKDGFTGDAQKAADTVVSTVQEVIDTNNPALLQDPALADSFMKLGAEGVSACGFTEVKVMVHEKPAASAAENPEFHFMELPKTLKAGPTAFAMDNSETQSFHDMVAFRLNDSFTGTLDDFIKLDDAGMSKAGTMAGMGLVGPKSSAIMNFDLKPGRYILLCHVPLMDGDGPDAQPKMGPTGPIFHFTIGMAQAVTVS